MQDGAQSCAQIASKAASLGMDSVALTDHGRCGGMLEFKKACMKEGVKPIYGFEAYVAPESRFTKSKLDNHKKTQYHLTLLAKNEEGLRNIFRLTSIGFTDGYYYKPRIDHESLENNREGLVVLSGCPSGRLSQFILDERMDEAEEHLKYMKELFGDDFYLEVQNHSFDWEYDLKTQLFILSERHSVPIVATQDSHYQAQKDAELHGAICKLTAGDLEFGTDQIYFKDIEEMKEMFYEDEHHALYQTQTVANKCNCNWVHDKTIWPVIDLPEGQTPDQELKRKTEEGFLRVFGEDTSCLKEYHDRVEYELGIIKDMGFATYFLVVADFINWAKSQKIAVGPGRGSGAGSLVCYFTGITNVDPIKYGLYFERFLNPARVSLPDLDIDFCKARREEVIDYVKQKYGPERVSQIGTYAEFKPRGSLRDFARILGHEKIAGETLASMVPPDSAGRTLTFDEVIKSSPEILKTEWPDVVKYARQAEGLKKQAGLHAAGVLISDSDLSAQIPLFANKNGGQVASQFNKDEVEEVGLVKYDFLGLKNLTVIQECIDLVEKNKGVKIDIDAIDEYDEKVFSEIFHNVNLNGIFQFENSSGFKDTCLQVKPVSIEDLSAITALFRPGPLTAKENPDDKNSKTLVQKYIAGRNGEETTYLFPELEPILKDTHGVMAYQEQVMRICQDCAGYTLAEADNMRKIIGKKLPEKMALEKEKLISGCVANGISETSALKLFKNIEGFADYSFNKAHSVAYSVISYQTAWLKTYYPCEFYTALFNASAQENQDHVVKYIYACKEEGISIMSPDVNISEAMFTTNGDTIVFGLSGLKGLGKKECLSIIEERNLNGPFTSVENMINRKINKRALKVLASSSALEEISDIPRSLLVEKLEEIITYYKDSVKWDEGYQKRVQNNKDIEEWMEHKDGPKPRKLQKQRKERPILPDLSGESTLSKAEALSLERSSLGFYLTGHPMDDFPGLSRLSKYSVSNIVECKDIYDGEKIALPVVISSVTKKRTKSGADMAILKVEDKTGRYEATIFTRPWKKLKNRIHEDKVYSIKCRVNITEVDTDDGTVSIARLAINDVEEIMEDNQAGMLYPIEIMLNDGSSIVFTPDEEMQISKYQQAIAIAKNIRRMC